MRRAHESSPMERAIWWCWLALLVAVPVTSFPLVEATIGGETVSPLSLVPLLILLVIFVVPHIVRRGDLPGELGPLLVFLGIALLSSLISIFLPLEPYKGQTVVTRTIHGLSTLAIGIGFYLCSALLPRDEHKMRASLRALYIGGGIMLLWAAIQSYFVLRGVRIIPWQLNQIHRILSVRDLFPDRLSGLAYEPSWFGNQLVMLYLPLGLGCLVEGWQVVGRPGRFPWIPLVLTIGAIFALLLSRSRISIMSLFAILAVLGLMGLWRLTGRLGQGRTKEFAGARSLIARLLAIVLALGLVVGLLAGYLRLGARFDWRIRRILSAPSQLAALQHEHPFELTYALADRGAFAERVIYWRAGLTGFERYPLLGVGLGNTGFLFEAGVPLYGYRLMEIQRALDPENTSFPNPKNLWIRILSETGFVGGVAFLAWMVLIGAAALVLRKYRQAMPRVVGMAGVLALSALVVEGFSLDTFALPHTWILFGLATAQTRQLRSSELAMPEVLVAVESA